MSAQGTRYQCSVCSSKFVVMTAGDGDAGCSHEGLNAAGVGSQLGKRYTCSRCGQLVLCLSAGTGTLTCHEAAMDVVPPQQLPSGD
jgi:DNA-directed RNA polymerase subunit RPC12/RpoP